MEFANKYEFEATVEQVFDAMINPGCDCFLPAGV